MAARMSSGERSGCADRRQMTHGLTPITPASADKAAKFPEPRSLRFPNSADGDTHRDWNSHSVRASCQAAPGQTIFSSVGFLEAFQTSVSRARPSRQARHIPAIAGVERFVRCVTGRIKSLVPLPPTPGTQGIQAGPAG